MDYREPSNIGSMRGITSSVKYLLIVNIAVYLIEGWFHFPLRDMFSLQADWMKQLAFGQLFTYMFVHANFKHLFMNMLTLFFIGPTVERTLGSYRFFILYYLSGILGGLGWSLLAPTYASCLGASGAIMGVLGAFGALYPNSTLLLWFVLPIKTWVLVAGLGIWELFETIGHPKIGGIANAAHLMGGIAGFMYAFSLRHPHIIQSLKAKLPSLGKANPKSARQAAGGAVLSKAEIDHILDKIGKQGMGALTPREREMLKNATRR
ncbi:MAG: rhomboid family intramembrane serine protease [Kiritimatiellales bacterium]|nr:rhomboid family intramembrane serine protease [Kiritimatiellales bacterium]